VNKNSPNNFVSDWEWKFHNLFAPRNESLRHFCSQKWKFSDLLLHVWNIVEDVWLWILGEDGLMSLIYVKMGSDFKKQSHILCTY